ncbi:MAG TPA: hypothetical protein VM368_05985 [Flavisolibacter sp.]|nr:hypothetical protein [Flavisolibacter sp.]
MRKVIFSSFITIAFLHSKSQIEKWDSSYRPPNYELRAEQFKSYPNTAGTPDGLHLNAEGYNFWKNI